MSNGGERKTESLYPRPQGIRRCGWGLPEKARDALVRAGKEAMMYERTKVAEMLATDDKLMQEHGMELLGVVEDLPEWVRLGRTAWPKCYEVIGDGDAAKGKAVIDIVLTKKETLAKR